MPATQSEQELDIALSAIENLEIKSLAWGFVDDSLSEAEAEEVIRDELARRGRTGEAADLLDMLVEEKAVRRFFANEERRYRTRFSELTRLLVRLRQLFPQKAWQLAPALVSDFRADIRERIYPRRNISIGEAYRSIEELGPLSPLQRRVWDAVVDHLNGLSRFQTEAIKRILRAPAENGTIVTAGTGSGKTLSFYIPAFLSVVSTLKRSDPWVRSLCIYPRQELLKDQLSEAYRLATKVRLAVPQTELRPISFGSLFRATPSRATVADLQKSGWVRKGADFIAPMLRCPACYAEMKWRADDIAAQKERLVCIRPQCDGETTADSMRLTRESIRRTPPDFLFTTTEMMNQRLSDGFARHIFGVGVQENRRPLMVLLDEVHTYSGTSGAQIALLLRRWRHLINTPVRWVGLSATLRHADEYFANLTGVRRDAVIEVTPKPEDMEAEGAEYQLILRSDPTSRAATLSTSIQAAMLTARMLDQPGGKFGRRLFVFTDDLDVTHRLFDDLRDAEAYDRFGKPDAERDPLALLRASGQADGNSRELDGQQWILAEDLRASLGARLVIGRTTSRDPGVDGRADVIVATASLEVGFNDPEVGAVLQHKAPRSVASYMQRRGRAGRRRGMRPLTLTVLSDYGHDRVAFQSYEHLFEPTIEPQALPIKNIYVLRIQATYALCDWLTARLASSNIRGIAWASLAGPGTPNFDDSSYRSGVIKILQLLIKGDEPTLTNLRDFLQRSLQIDEVVCNTLLWEPPRALLLEAIPTLLRRLFRDWKLAGGTGVDVSATFHPLPDFIPRNLFGELGVPEVTIIVPGATRHDDEHDEPLSVLQSLTQFAPGRVRRRFADEYGGLAHWSPINPDAKQEKIPIEGYAERAEYIGKLPLRRDGQTIECEVFRPWRMAVAKVEAGKILHSSNSRWRWLSHFEPDGTGFVIEVPKRILWSKIIPTLNFNLHRFSAPMSVARYAVDGVAEIRTRAGRATIPYSLVDAEQKPVGVGYATEVDALVIYPAIPSNSIAACTDIPPDLRRWLRFLYFSDLVLRDDVLPADINVFERDWLIQIVLLTILLEAEGESSSLAAAIDSLSNQQGAAPFAYALKALAGTTASVSDALEAEEEGVANPASITKLEEALRERLDDFSVVQRLYSLAKVALSGDTLAWAEWMQACSVASMGEAALQACVVAAPSNTAREGLSCDIETIDGRIAIVISEGVGGGGGTLEALAHKFSLEPQAFFRALESVVARTDLEEAADSLDQIYAFMYSDEKITHLVESLRVADGHDERMRARQDLYAALGERGIPVTRSLSVSIATRLIRPGTVESADRVVQDFQRYRGEIQDRYDLECPVRVVAALAVRDERFLDRLRDIGGLGNELGTANLLLWPQGGELRRNSLRSYNPFKTQGATDTEVVRNLLREDDIGVVSTLAETWYKDVVHELSEHGAVRLMSADSSHARLRAAIISLSDEPIYVGDYQFFPTVEAFKRRSNGSWSVDLTLREWVG